MSGGDGDYAAAKTSVWWDIENCQVPEGYNPNAIAKNITTSLANFNYRGPVSISAYGDTTRIPASVQHALSSTGIALNHVPAGGEDASDKKILVDMLFWAVDNPAPANYLLISGDRVFSNALHQLRMRRYNILLAQPLQVSLPHVAAATAVWLWTSLSAGGEPLSRVKSTVANVNASTRFNKSNSDVDFNYVKQSSLSRAFSAPVSVLDCKSDESCCRPQYGIVKQFKKAPHEFFQSSKAVVSAALSTPCVGGCSADNVLPLDPARSHGYRPECPRPFGVGFSSSGLQMSVPDIGKLHISEYPSSLLSNVDFYPAVEKPKTRPSEFHKPAALDTTYRGHVRPGLQASYWRPHGPAPSLMQTVSDRGMRRNEVHPPTPPYMLDPVRIILVALETLKIERVMPTEANITDCVRFGDPRDFSTDVRKALDSAIAQNVVMKQRVGALELYIGRNEKLWHCVNPVGGNPNQYSNAIWDNIQQFLTSSYGRSAILASNCRYEAALILRNECLESLALGDVLRILNMVVHPKKWIIHHQPGWQPIAISLKEFN